MEEAEDEAVGAGGEKLLGVGQGRGVLRLRVAEAALPRANHRHDREIDGLLCNQKFADGGGQAPVEEAGIEFDAVCAAVGGLQDVFHAAAADLKCDFLHGVSSVLRISSRVRTEPTR